MVSRFYEKRFPRIRRDVVIIVSVQSCEGFVLFINCFYDSYFQRLADLSFLHVW